MHWFKKVLRLASFVLLSMLATSALMYYAPGYFSDAREMDGKHAAVARGDLEQRRNAEGTFAQVCRTEIGHWLHGDLGRSRQYDVAVRDLLQERSYQSAHLLLTGVALGWSGAFTSATLLLLWHSRKLDLLSAGISSALLGLPVGALATVCLLSNLNTPGLVLAAVIGVRDFKLQHRMLHSAFRAPHILQARAHGLSSFRILVFHVVPHLRRELLTILFASFTLALSVLVPVEVIFDLPGLGHLAWSAAMNRDMPVLVAITAVMAGCVGLASHLAQPTRTLQSAPCVQ